MRLKYTAGGTIPANRFVKFDSTDTTVVQAAAATDLILGIYSGPSSASSSDEIVVALDGECRLDVAGSVTRGQLLTADSNGKGVTAAPSAGSNNRIGAVALQSGTDTTIRVLITHASMQG